MRSKEQEGSSIKNYVFPSLSNTIICLIVVLIPAFATVIALVLIATHGFRNIGPLMAVVGLILAKYLALVVNLFAGERTLGRWSHNG